MKFNYAVRFAVKFSLTEKILDFLFINMDGKKEIHSTDVPLPQIFDIKVQYMGQDIMSKLIESWDTQFCINNNFFCHVHREPVRVEDLSPIFMEECKYKAYKSFLNLMLDKVNTILACREMLNSKINKAALGVGDNILTLSDQEARTIIENKINKLKELVK